jgi:hypothetical protein
LKFTSSDPTLVEVSTEILRSLPVNGCDEDADAVLEFKLALIRSASMGILVSLKPRYVDIRAAYEKLR